MRSRDMAPFHAHTPDFSEDFAALPNVAPSAKVSAWKFNRCVLPIDTGGFFIPPGSTHLPERDHEGEEHKTRSDRSSYVTGTVDYGRAISFLLMIELVGVVLFPSPLIRALKRVVFSVTRRPAKRGTFLPGEEKEAQFPGSLHAPRCS
ncbi:hypothetical protein CDAR_274281 [Caerostris darwini]|uniref:Uncharacterized protein n=1 Tax=Caerostris darwini TaxID=1538125 RepID=A0AAV4RD59_9ARAC|nr:hypothetical protein CDAR_274281 [Caerostris darwini]